MTRFIRLSCGGQIMIPSVERCPACDARARYVESEGTPFVDDDARYRCEKCGCEWPQVH